MASVFASEWVIASKRKSICCFGTGIKEMGCAFVLFSFGLVLITHVLVLQQHFVCVLQREKIITEAGTPHKTGLSASVFIAPLSRGQESKSFFMFCSSVDFM